MTCTLILVHQFNRMLPWSTWEGMLPGGCIPGKRCHTFLTMNIVLLRVVLAKVHCVPKITLCELYGVNQEPRGTREVVTQFLKDEHACKFWCSFQIVLYFA